MYPPRDQGVEGGLAGTWGPGLLNSGPAKGAAVYDPGLYCHLIRCLSHMRNKSDDLRRRCGSGP